MSLSPVPNYVWAGLFSAFSVGLAVYVADYSSPYTAGFLASFPVAMCSMIFVPREASAEISRTFALGILAYAFFAMLFYIMVAKNGWDHNKSVYVCVTAWMIVAVVMWLLNR